MFDEVCKWKIEKSVSANFLHSPKGWGLFNGVKLNLLHELNLNQFGCVNIDLGTLFVHMFCWANDNVMGSFLNGHSGGATSINFFIINLAWALGRLPTKPSNVRTLCIQIKWAHDCFPRRNWNEVKKKKWSGEFQFGF